MFFDLHSDIPYDIVQKRLMGKKHIIKDYHLPQLEKGNFIGGIWCYYTDISNELCSFAKAIELILEELEEVTDDIKIIKKQDDIDLNKINVILGLEGLAPVKDIEYLEALYKLGFRHAMLTWNEENQFATGVKGDINRGLSELGKEVIRFMIRNKMIIDISHANLQTVNDILKVTKRVIASHSNVYELCAHPRNLPFTYIKEISQNGGLIGITAVKSFVNPENPTIKGMINHLDYLVNQGLIDSIAFGFDFMDYMDIENLIDFHNASETEKIIHELKARNYDDSLINNLTHKNALDFITTYLE
ncbi:MAG: peptidase [Bacilli bacterium]|nr:peptidase [Bacilli bacterium]